MTTAPHNNSQQDTERAARLRRLGPIFAALMLAVSALTTVAMRELFHLPWKEFFFPMIFAILIAWLLAFRPSQFLALNAAIERFISKDRGTTWGQWMR